MLLTGSDTRIADSATLVVSVIVNNAKLEERERIELYMSGHTDWLSIVKVRLLLYMAFAENLVFWKQSHCIKLSCCWYKWKQKKCSYHW